MNMYDSSNALQKCMKIAMLPEHKTHVAPNSMTIVTILHRSAPTSLDSGHPGCNGKTQVLQSGQKQNIDWISSPKQCL